MGKIARYLNQLIVGNVFDAPEILESYATDRSILRIKPKAVAIPESTEDVQKLMGFCYQLASKGVDFPATVRGSGLDEMGGDLANGLIISTEKLDKLLESDRRERLVRVQSGITLKELNTALSLHGLTIPVGGHELETIGGIISNCPADALAGKYGGIMNYVQRIEVVLPNGDILQTERLGHGAVAKKIAERTTEGVIYRKIGQIIKNNPAMMGKLRARGHGLYGYPNIARVNRGRTIDLAPIFFGAEGTLGVITEVILRAVPLTGKPCRLVATFETFRPAQRFMDEIAKLSPRELDFYDIKITKTAEETGKRLGSIVENVDRGFVVFAKFDQRRHICVRKVETLGKTLPRTSRLILESEKDSVVLDEFENSLTSFLGQVNAGERVPIVTDFYIPAANLGHFLEDLSVVEGRMGMDLALYGSYLTSNYNLRPNFRVQDDDFGRKALAFLRAGNLVIKRRGGTITGGSPEGRVKAVVTNADISKAERDLYIDIKAIFDKYNIMNPAAKIGADARYTMNHLRSTGLAKIVL